MTAHHDLVKKENCSLPKGWDRNLYEAVLVKKISLLFAFMIKIHLRKRQLTMTFSKWKWQYTELG